MSEHPTPDHIMQVGLGFWASKALLSAIEMEVFTELARHPEDLAALRERLGLHERSARDFLDALVALGFLERRDGVYSNTPSTDLFLDKRKPSYLGGILEMANHRLYGFWGNLTEGLRTGRLQNEAKTGDLPFFEALYADPARLREFLEAMSGLSHGANVAIAERFPWKDHATFVDVGTAQGDLAVQIALANPHLTGSGFDLPEVAPVFEDYVERNGLAGRLAFAAGDFFSDDLPRADVITMGHILHDWDLDQKRILIGKAYEALPPGGRAGRLRGDHRRRPLPERLRPPHEPQHADRDRGRLRLHRRRLHGLDARGRLLRRPRGASGRARLDGGRHQVVRAAGWAGGRAGGEGRPPVLTRRACACRDRPASVRHHAWTKQRTGPRRGRAPARRRSPPRRASAGQR